VGGMAEQASRAFKVPPATGTGTEDGRERSVRFVGASSLTLSCDSLSLPFSSFYGFCFLPSI
jgi:hypothetical protein